MRGGGASKKHSSWCLWRPLLGDGGSLLIDDIPVFFGSGERISDLGSRLMLRSGSSDLVEVLTGSGQPLVESEGVHRGCGDGCCGMMAHVVGVVHLGWVASSEHTSEGVRRLMALVEPMVNGRW